jgi:hypothetical protein
MASSKASLPGVALLPLIKPGELPNASDSNDELVLGTTEVAALKALPATHRAELTLSAPVSEPSPLVVITDMCEVPASGKPPSLLDEPPCANPVVIADEAEAAATGEPPPVDNTPPPSPAVAIIDSCIAPTPGEPPPPIDEPLPALTVVNAPVRPEAVCVCTSFWGQSLAISGG